MTSQAEVEYLDAWYAKHAPPADADADADGRADADSDAGDDGARLWRSAECRARWLAAVGAASSVGDLALGLLAFRAHARLFRVLTPPPRGAAEIRKAETDEEAARAFYRADAFARRRRRRALAA